MSVMKPIRMTSPDTWAWAAPAASPSVPAASAQAAEILAILNMGCLL